MLDEMIDLIMAVYLSWPGGADCYETAAHIVIQTGVGNYTGRHEARREWLRQLQLAAEAVCSCDEITSISPGVRLDWDMEALEKLTRCLAELARRKAELKDVTTAR